MRRLYPQFLGGWRGLGLLFVRLALGTAFILHGWQKIGNPLHWMDRAPNAAPAFLQLMSVVAEVGGGAFLIVGLLTPIATFLLSCDMIAAVALVHLPKGDPFVAPTATGSSYETALVYLAVAVAVMLIGPGRLSLDAMLFKRRDWVVEEKREWLKIPARRELNSSCHPERSEGSALAFFKRVGSRSFVASLLGLTAVPSSVPTRPWP